jgi:hypothetical protein
MVFETHFDKWLKHFNFLVRVHIEFIILCSDLKLFWTKIFYRIFLYLMSVTIIHFEWRSFAIVHLFIHLINIRVMSNVKFNRNSVSVNPYTTANSTQIATSKWLGPIPKRLWQNTERFLVLFSRKRLIYAFFYYFGLLSIFKKHNQRKNKLTVGW